MATGSRRGRTSAWSGLLAMSIAGQGLAGCAAYSQDVLAYYRQMAVNYQEAEDKAKTDALPLKTKAKNHLQVGDLRSFNKLQRELTRLKKWEAHCAYEHERFEAAAEKLEKRSGSKKRSTDAGPVPPSHGQADEGPVLERPKDPDPDQSLSRQAE